MPSEQQRTRVRRKPERAAYDFATVAAILDEALYAHVGVVRDGAPVVIPMLHARLDDQLYLHGPPLDPDADRELPIWAGVLPLGLVPTAPPVAAAGVPADLVPPAHVAAWSRGAVQSDGLVARPS